MEWRIPQVVGSDRVASEKVRVRTNTKDIVAVAQYQVEMGRPHGKNGPVQMGISDSNVGRHEATDGRGADTFKRTVVTNSQKPVRMGYNHTTYVKATLLRKFTY
jgi:hypothetical protein